MNKYLVLGFLLCLNAECVYAQWTEKDSIWLVHLLSGKDTIRLNPEFQKAIRSGTLINNDTPGQHMKMAAPSSIPFSKDFSEYIHKEDTSAIRKVALKDLPPAVFQKYGPVYIYEPGVITQTREQLRGEQLRRPSEHDFDGMLRTVFQPGFRQKKRNAKRAATWKNYDNLPTPDVLKKRNKFQQQHDSLSRQAGHDSINPVIAAPATSRSSAVPN